MPSMISSSWPCGKSSARTCGSKAWPTGCSGAPAYSRSTSLRHQASLSRATLGNEARVATYPSIIPVLSLDRVYMRGLHCKSIMVPRGSTWARLSDHLPLVAELDLNT